MRDIEKIVLHYLVAALWTNELDELSAECDIDPESKKIATKVVEKFLELASPLLTKEWTDEQIGHDLWLTRGGHGAGFWDRNLPNGDELSAICDTMRFNGEVYEENGVAYINNDNF